LDGNKIDILKNIEEINFADSTLQSGIIATSKAVLTSGGLSRQYIFTGSEFNDQFTSTQGNDVFRGNGGKDVFNFDIGTTTGIDRILDFTAGADGDQILLDTAAFASFEDLSRNISATSNGVIIDLGQNGSITLSLVGVGDLTADNFNFPIPG
jgi:hypothetical protein